MRVSSINGSDRFCASSMMTTTNASPGELIEKLGEQVAELGARGLPQCAGGQLLNRQRAEVDQQHLQQIFARRKRVRHERAVGIAAEVPQHGAAQRGLAGADLARQDEQAFAPTDAGEQTLSGREVVRTVVVETRIGVEAERLLGQAEERLVGKGVRTGTCGQFEVVDGHRNACLAGRVPTKRPVFRRNSRRSSPLCLFLEQRMTVLTAARTSSIRP